MKRRSFMALTAGAFVMPGLALAGEVFVDYTPGLINEALAKGDTILVDYSASWCSTCKAQERVINKLTKANPDYLENILFVRVDWDDFGREEVSTSRNIPRRSTLLVLKGEEELGRIVAGTKEATIKELLDTALKVSS